MRNIASLKTGTDARYLKATHKNSDWTTPGQILVWISRVNPYGAGNGALWDSERSETRYLGNTSEMTGSGKCWNVLYAWCTCYEKRNWLFMPYATNRGTAAKRNFSEIYRAKSNRKWYAYVCIWNSLNEKRIRNIFFTVGESASYHDRSTCQIPQWK